MLPVLGIRLILVSHDLHVEDVVIILSGLGVSFTFDST